MTRQLIKEQLRNTPLWQVSTYLMSTGWLLDGMIGSVGSIWHRKEAQHSDAELILPETNEIRDCEDRLADVVEQLSIFEMRPAEEVVRAINTYFCDLISVRIVHADVEGGTIPLDDGVLLFERIRDLMTAATLSTISKRRHFSGNRPPEAINFLSSLKLGQTEVGSYVANVIAPVQHSSSNQDSIEKTSIGRVVTANLATGLQALLVAVDSYKKTQELSVFDRAVDSGVSANMCEALVGLSGEKKDRGFSISISPSHQQTFGLDMVKQHTFDKNFIPEIEMAAEYYRENYVIPEFTVVGFVKKLNRDPDDDNGTVTVAAIVQDVERNVTFDLAGDEYRDAIHAHENKQVVSCAGDLKVSSRSAILLNSKDFKIISNGNLFL